MPAAARFVDGLTKQHDAKEAEMKDALKRLKERGSEVVESSMRVLLCLILFSTLITWHINVYHIFSYYVIMPAGRFGPCTQHSTE